MPIIEIIKAVKKNLNKSADAPTKVPALNEYALFLLEITQKKLIEHERKKYPSPPYKYNRETINFAKEGEKAREKVITYIQYNGSPLDETHTATMVRESLLTRKLSIIAGILNAIDFTKELTPGYLGITSQTQQKVLDFLSTFLEDDIIPFNNAEQTDVFIGQLIEKISEITGANKKAQEELIRQIRTAERYFVAEYKANQILINETKINNAGKSLIQVDDYFNNMLAPEQKLEFIQIHNQDKKQQPTWFVLLPAWEQAWLLKIIPKDLTADWSAFERLSQSSAMSHIPGIQNARMNYLVEFDGQEYTLLSRSFKTGTMVPYELPVPGDMLPQYVEQTALQVLGQLERQVTADFRHIWQNISLPDSIRPLIFIQSLLSNDSFVTKIIAEIDIQLTVNQKEAIEKIISKNIFPKVDIITGNDPLNLFRIFSASAGYVSEKAGNWKHSQQILDYADKFITFLETEPQLNVEQKDRLALMKAARNELNKLRNEDYKSQKGQRNFIAYKAAYTSILIEAMGGITSTNCKSGKDRTGVDELYKNAMSYYFHIYKKLPKFDDESTDRKNFIDIFVLLFNSMKTQEAGGGNTPGSFGLKLDAIRICTDIQKSIGTAFELTQKLGDLNKPQKFLDDEAASGKARKASVSGFLKQEKVKAPYLQFKEEIASFVEKYPLALKVPAFVEFYEMINEGGSESKSPPKYLSAWRLLFEALQAEIIKATLLLDEIKSLGEELKIFSAVQNLSDSNTSPRSKSLGKKIAFLLTYIDKSADLFLKSRDLSKTLNEVQQQVLPQMGIIFEQLSEQLEQDEISSLPSSAKISTKAEVAPAQSTSKIPTKAEAAPSQPASKGSTKTKAASTPPSSKVQTKTKAPQTQPSPGVPTKVMENPNTLFNQETLQQGMKKIIAHYDKLSAKNAAPAINPNLGMATTTLKTN